MTFQGYTNETIEFFMAIRFNNNRAFFQDNRDWYLRAVREPSLALAEALIPAVEAFDERLETRPNRVVSRINRDVRFSHDKSPYRDHVWMSFRQPDVERGRAMGLFFEVSAEGACYGMGCYNPERAMMNALRRHMRLSPAEPEALLTALPDDFSLLGPAYKRMKLPGNLPEALAPWYARKSFYLERTLPLTLAKTPALADELRAGFARLKPLYDYIVSCTPEEEDFL